MHWLDHKVLAVGLRDQGLADCVAARTALRPGSIKILGNKTSLAHVVVAKSQQVVEKVTKGYLLWHSKSFDPTKGHTPFTKTLELPENQRPLFNALCAKLNRLNRNVIAELKWLESLAPRAIEVHPDQRGKPWPLANIPENTEYPFWSRTSMTLVTSASGLSMEDHGIRAIKGVRTFLRAISNSDPPQFTKGVQEFLEDLPFSTAISVCI